MNEEEKKFLTRILRDYFDKTKDRMKRSCA